MSEAERYGKWEVIEFIDQGGQGRVYRVRDVSGSESGMLRNRDLENAIAIFSAISGDEERENAASQLADAIRAVVRESAAPIGALKVLLPIEEGVAEDEEAALERMKLELSALARMSRLRAAGDLGAGNHRATTDLDRKRDLRDDS